MITLGGLWTKFDKLCQQHNVTKIKTLGDGFLAAAGLQDDINHAESIVDYALDCFKTLDRFNQIHNTKHQMRCGIHCGPLTAGVVGNERFSYDIFGPTVNIAFCMQTTGEPNAVHVSESIYKMISDSYVCKKVAAVDTKIAKGIGSHVVVSRTQS